MTEIVFLVEEAPEAGLSARAPGESIFTQADSTEASHDEVRDAVRCHIEKGGQPPFIRISEPAISRDVDRAL